jgi:hypothetical protein
MYRCPENCVKCIFNIDHSKLHSHHWSCDVGTKKCPACIPVPEKQEEKEVTLTVEQLRKLHHPLPPAGKGEDKLLSEEEIARIGITHDEFVKITEAADKYEPQCFMGCFMNDERNKLLRRKIVKAQSALTRQQVLGSTSKPSTAKPIRGHSIPGFSNINSSWR